MPFSIAMVAMVRRNLWGWTWRTCDLCPSFFRQRSTPAMVRRFHGACTLTNRAGSESVRVARYCCKWIFVFASKYTGRSLSPFPRTIHSRSTKLMSERFSLTSSPTRMPVDVRRSMIARSRGCEH